MEQYWNKKRIGLVLGGDADSLELFYSQHKPVLFTWMYYQVGADADIAADLTARTFDRAMEQLTLFDPHRVTLLQWLREHARAARDEGLLRWQLKPQRPWAWSQLPDPILNSLAAIRSEPLGNSVAENPFVQEIVQAALAEMEQTDRELMMHRYNHLDTPSNIAAEMDLSVEAVNDLLYKCRHSFRRVFFRLISSVNPGFAESNAGAGIEMLDGNLEKLLRATGMYQVPSDTQEATIRERYHETVQRVAHAQPAAKPPAWRMVTAFIAAALLIAGVWAWHLRDTPAPGEPQDITVESAPAATDRPAAADQPAGETPRAARADISEEELKLILQLGQAGQVEALREFLKSGLFASQIASAHFISKLGGPADIELLEAAENQWYANGPADNPFAQAIREIAQRYPDAVTLADPVPPPTTAGNVPDNGGSAQDTATLNGHVTGFSGGSVSGARIEIAANPLFSRQALTPVAQTVTDETGNYRINQPLDGAYFVKCTSALAELQSVRRAIWVNKGAAVQCDFGGSSVVSGNIGLNGRPVSGLRLILSDADEPAQAAFLAEAAADDQGDFTFTGVEPGTYRLLSLAENKELICLESSLRVGADDFFRVALDLTPVSVMVDYPEPNAVSGARLAHVFDASYEERTAGFLPDGNLQFSNVIAGRYLLRLELTDGIRLEQSVDIQAGLQNQVITVEPPTAEFVSLTGRIIGAASAGLRLETPDRRVQIPVKTASDGTLDLPGIPADFYHLAANVRGTRVVFTSIDLTDLASPEVEMEIDLGRLAEGLSAFYAIVTDSEGQILSGATLSLAGDELTVAESTARGTFLAAPAGSQTLHADLAGYVPRQLQLDLNQPLTTEPSKNNITVIELSR